MNQVGIYAVITAAQGGLIWLLQSYYSEKIKKRFDDRTEILKSELQKQNITYQANISKYVEYKFERVSRLHKVLTSQYNQLFELLPDGIVVTVSMLKKMQDDAETDYNTFKNVLDDATPYISEELKNKIQIFGLNLRAEKTLQAEVEIGWINWYDFQENPNVQSEGAEYYENLKSTIDENIEKVKKLSITVQKTFRELSNSIIDVLKSN